MFTNKRKRKPLPKRLCPCGCGGLLTERSIIRHRDGKHLPTHIRASQHAAQFASSSLHVSFPPSLSFEFNHSGRHNARQFSPDLDSPSAGDVAALGVNLEPGLELSVLDPTPAVVHSTWSGRRAAVDEYVSDSDDEAEGDGLDTFSGEDTNVEPEFGLNNGPGLEDAEEEYGEEDVIDEDLERLFAQFKEELSDADLDMLRSYALKVGENLSEKTWAQIRHVYHRHNIPSLKVTKARVEFLAAYKPVSYDCCINSCICYVGPHEAKTRCPYCNEDRKNNLDHPRKTFTYSPIIPRLRTAYKDSKAADAMRYRANFISEQGLVKDILDGENYKMLKEEYVTVGGIQQNHRFFEDGRDVALGLSLDGFCPFKRRKQTCWPLILFNYNLSPEIRFHLRNILCVGVIPGPSKPHDADSFAYPLVEELLELLSGVSAFDITENERFVLRAYLLAVFGDIPAISMIMRMKGHNAIFPCRMCMIKGVRIPETRSTTHYVPLYRANHPTVLAAPGDTPEIAIYDAANLPLRMHDQFLAQARNVQFAPSSAEEQRRAKACGIKGIPLLSHLPSLFFPTSFPFDFMHLIWENLIPNLILLWTGKFKGLDEGDESYEFCPGVWEAIGAATKRSGSTIPSAYVSSRPPNVAEEAYACTADSWSFWTLYLGPTLLKGRFRNDVYYKHFVELVVLLNYCLQFEITKEEIAKLRVGFQEWVTKFEKIYYQNSPERVSTCPLTVHGLLHIADSIEAMGPVWAYWAFPMERFCGKLGRNISSHRHPFENIASYLTAVAQLQEVKNRFNVHEDLSLLPPSDGNVHEFEFDEYPSLVLCYPRVKNPTISDSLYSKITAALATRYNVERKTITPHLSRENIEFWGRFRRLEGGDTMRAAAVGQAIALDRRDATHVRYQLLVDKYANNRRKTPYLELRTFYGQIQQIILIRLSAAPQLNLSEPTAVIFASIKNCRIERHHNILDIHYYRSEEGPTEVVDLATVQCLVGRVYDRGEWAVIDRSGKLAREDSFEG